ncbi:hypothetical protein DFH11DRAFT_1726637 [Phellopilus nigrolimitatus]|nr:hypothetical protein DFH11DRAFT_1726637 [Phellopilus nigrolimitatus]
MPNAQLIRCSSCNRAYSPSLHCKSCGSPPIDYATSCQECSSPLPPPRVAKSWDINPAAYEKMQKEAQKQPNENDWRFHRPEQDWTNEQKVMFFDLMLAHAARSDEDFQKAHSTKKYSNYTPKKPMRLIHERMVDKLLKGLVNLAMEETDRHFFIIDFNLDMLTNLKTPNQDSSAVALCEAFSTSIPKCMHKERSEIERYFADLLPKMATTLTDFANAAKTRREWSNEIMISNAFAKPNVSDPRASRASREAINETRHAQSTTAKASRLKASASSPAKAMPSQGMQPDIFNTATFSPKVGPSPASTPSLSSVSSDSTLEKMLDDFGFDKGRFAEFSPAPVPRTPRQTRLQNTPTYASRASPSLHSQPSTLDSPHTRTRYVYASPQPPPQYNFQPPPQIVYQPHPQMAYQPPQQMAYQPLPQLVYQPQQQPHQEIFRRYTLLYRTI